MKTQLQDLIIDANKLKDLTGTEFFTNPADTATFENTEKSINQMKDYLKFIDNISNQKENAQTKLAEIQAQALDPQLDGTLARFDIFVQTQIKGNEQIGQSYETLKPFIDEARKAIEDANAAESNNKFFENLKDNADSALSSIQSVLDNYQTQINDAFDTTPTLEFFKQIGNLKELSLPSNFVANAAELFGTTNNLDVNGFKSYIASWLEFMADMGNFDPNRIDEVVQKVANAATAFKASAEVVNAKVFSSASSDLQSQLEALKNNGRELTVYEETLQKIKTDYKDLDQTQKDNLLTIASQIDAQKQLNESYSKLHDNVSDVVNAFASGKSISEGFGNVFKLLRDKFKRALIEMTTDFLTSRFFGLLSGKSLSVSENNGNAGSSGGGFLSGLINSIRGIFGGNRSGASSGGGFGTPSFNPNGGSFFSNNFVGGGAIGGSVFKPNADGSFNGTGLAQALGLLGSVRSGSSTVGIGSLLSGGGIGSAVGGIAPILGAVLGSKFGGKSGLGNILGGLGGLGLGLSATAFLAPGLIGSIVGSSASFGAIGLLTNPFTLAAGVALLVGARILAVNKQRRKDETTRNTSMLDTLKGLNDILSGLNANPPRGADSAISESNTISANYFQMANGLKSKKTREIALKDGRERVTPLVNQIALLVPDAKARAANIDDRRNRLNAYEFAGGTYFDSNSYKGFKRRNGLLLDGVPGRDTIPAFLMHKEIVANEPQQNRMRLVGQQFGIDDIWAYGNIPNYPVKKYADGAYIGQPSTVSSQPASGKSNTVIVNEMTLVLENVVALPDAKGFLESADGQRTIVKIIKKAKEQKDLR
jgi:hypothetical protein